MTYDAISGKLWIVAGLRLIRACYPPWALPRLGRGIDYLGRFFW